MRSLRNSPGFTASAIITLTVAIAAVVTVYSMYSRVILNPLAADEPEMLVSMYATNPGANFVPPTLSWPRFQFIASSLSMFSSMGAYSAESVSFRPEDGPAEQLAAWRVSHGFFDVWGGQVARGRPFTVEENLLNGPAVSILSHEFWLSRFGDRDMIGERIMLNGTLTEIVGILAPAVSPPWGGRPIFIPRVFDDSAFSAAAVNAGASYIEVIARLRAGTTAEQATAELAANSRAYRELHAGNGDATNEIQLRPLIETVVGAREPVFLALLGGSIAVFLIACTNVAALFLGWRARRERETAIRLALGAKRTSIVRSVMSEALTIAGLAGICGVAVATGTLTFLQGALADQLPAGVVLRLDYPAAGIAILAVMVAMALIAFAPAMQAMRSRAIAPLSVFHRGGSTDIRARRFRSALVVFETALSVVLLVCAGLLLISLSKLFSTSPGFEYDGLVGGYVHLPIEEYDSGERQVAFFDSVLARLQSSPGVNGAAVVFGLPFHDENYAHTYLMAGQPVVPPSERQRAGLRIVSNEYFSVMGMRMVSGRTFTALDHEGAPRVCIVNETLQRRLFAGASALGNVLLRGRDADQACEIVGVVADVKTNGLKQPTPDEIYYPFKQSPRRNAFFIARASSESAALPSLLRNAVAEVDSNLPVARVMSMRERMAGALGAERTMSGVTAILAVAALGLATLGLYAVLAHSVTTRTAEIGIRMALGAPRRAVICLVVSQGMRLVTGGVAIGLAAAWAVSRLLSAHLFGVEPGAPVVYLVVALLFLFVGVLSALGPATRGSGIDPVVALRP